MHLIKCTFIHYSVLKASTGFLFAAALAGINPEIKVNATETQIIIIACHNSSDAIV